MTRPFTLQLSKGELLVASLLFLAACTTSVKPDDSKPKVSSAPKKSATVFIAAELKGYLGPCGCSENMRGGIARAAYQLEQARAAGGKVALIDTGDSLFGAASLSEDAVPQQERKARALADAFKKMGLTTRAPGPLDDARGPEFRQSLGLPELPADQVQLLDVGFPLGVVSADTFAQLQTRAALARTRGAVFVLGLFRAPLEEVTQSLKDGAAVDLIIATRAKDELSGETSRMVRGAIPVLAVQTKGRSLLKLELNFHEPGKFELLKGGAEQERDLYALDQRIELLRGQVNEPSLGEEMKVLRKAKLEELVRRRETLAATPLVVPEGVNSVGARFIPLEPNFPMSESVKALVTEYDRDVGLLNVKWAQEHGKPCPAPDKGKAGFIGTQECKTCHEDAFKVWQASKHSHAYATLETVGKQHHLDCIGCHVVGWQKEGGVCRVDQVALLKDVGCESCHGPGSTHAESPDDVKLDLGKQPAACLGCHDRENSPHFDFEKYLPNVLGPGHGQPAPPKPVVDAGVPDAGVPAAKKGSGKKTRR